MAITINNTTPAPAAGSTFVPRKDPAMDAAQSIVQTEGPIKKLYGELFVLRGGAWQPADADVLAMQSLGTHATKPSQVKSVVQALHMLAAKVIEITPSRHHICFLNGTYDIRTGQLGDHNPALNLRNPIPFDYDPEAKCPKFLSILSQLFEGDQDEEEKRKMLQEVFGLSLSSRSCGKILALIGDDDNGVGLILEGLYVMVGAANTTVFSLDQFHSQDVCAAVEGKLLNVTSSLSARRLNSNNKLGQLAAGSRIEMSRKGERPYQFKPYAKFVVCTSTLSSLVGGDDGLMCRFAPLVFTGALPASQRESCMEDLSQEMPGIINWALQGLHRVIQQGHLTEPPSSNACLQAYSEEVDPLRLFADECLRRSEDGTGLYSAEILHAYKAWGVANGHKVKESTIVLGRKLAKLGYKSHKSGTTVWEVWFTEGGKVYGFDNSENPGDVQVDVASSQAQVHKDPQMSREIPPLQPAAYDDAQELQVSMHHESGRVAASARP